MKILLSSTLSIALALSGAVAAQPAAAAGLPGSVAVLPPEMGIDWSIVNLLAGGDAGVVVWGGATPMFHPASGAPFPLDTSGSLNGWTGDVEGGLITWVISGTDGGKDVVRFISTDGSGAGSLPLGDQHYLAGTPDPCASAAPAHS